MNICIVEKDITEIELIKPLWEQLNSIHLDKSIYLRINLRIIHLIKEWNLFLKRHKKVL